MESSETADLRRRVEERIRFWRIVVDRIAETESSVLVFGRRDHQSVVLKVIRTSGDEWHSGDVLDAFDGNGIVRIYEHVEGALLLERLEPGHSLVSLATSGEDDKATGILAALIRQMSPRTPARTVSTVKEWGRGFERYGVSGSTQIPAQLCLEAHRIYQKLCDSQSRVRLLHGDLHHHNVLFDSERGWVAVDPKGVVGETEYEVGAALRNPYESPELFTKLSVLEKRVERFARELNLDATRVLAWAFAQAVLSAIWALEDGFGIEPGNRWIALARTIRPMLA
jgi:streptomycin 6-kinase